MKLSALASYAAAAYNYDGPFFVRRLTDCTIIAVRGTRDPKDFVTDLEFLQHRFLGYGAHEGFLNEFCDLWGPVSKALSIKDKVYVTGHSLGGAVATLLAMALKMHLNIKSTVATFGSPRVFDDAGAEAYNQCCPDTIRVVHNLDLVPRIPKLGYYHVDHELHLDDNGKKLLNHDSWLRWLLKIVKSDLEGVSLANHHMPTYTAAVGKYEERYKL